VFYDTALSTLLLLALFEWFHTLAIPTRRGSTENTAQGLEVKSSKLKETVEWFRKLCIQYAGDREQIAVRDRDEEKNLMETESCV
jgi:hypothetical protein